jgi:KDO2-lipid IV(A) lauroyltransferase
LKARLSILLLKVSASLPLAVIHRLGDVLGVLMYRFAKRAVSTTRINLSLCFPEMNEAEREQLVRDSLKEMAKTALEMGPAWIWPAEKQLSVIKEVQGLEYIEQAEAEGKGFIVVAPHLGNWEILGTYLGQHFQSTCMYKPPKEPLLNDLIYQSRLKMGIQPAPIDRKGLVVLLKALRGGGSVGILPDQEPRLANGVFAPFFGQPALTMTLVSNLVKKSGALAVAAMLKRRTDSSGFTLIFKPIDQQLYSNDIETSVAALNRAVEACVKEAPAQYQWEYKRFKRQPDPEVRIYPKGL